MNAYSLFFFNVVPCLTGLLFEQLQCFLDRITHIGVRVLGDFLESRDGPGISYLAEQIGSVTAQGRWGSSGLVDPISP